MKKIICTLLLSGIVILSSSMLLTAVNEEEIQNDNPMDETQIPDEYITPDFDDGDEQLYEEEYLYPIPEEEDSDSEELQQIQFI